MSTFYYFKRVKDQPKLEDFVKFCQKSKLILGETDGNTHIFDGSSYIHYGTRPWRNTEKVCDFTRFGGNNPDNILDMIETEFGAIKSEYD